MTKETGLQWLRELLWWLVTAILAGLVLLPLYGTIGNSYLGINLLMIVTAITYFRFIIYLNHIPYLWHLYARVVLIVISIIAFWQFVRKLQDFLFVADNYTISSFLSPQKMFIDADAVQRSFLYFKQEFLLFNISVLILTVVMVLRTISSLWKLGKTM